MDTPYSQTSYTAEFIENQQAKTLADVLSMDPSATVASPGSGGVFIANTFMMRGFGIGPRTGSAEGAVQINGMYGLAPNYLNQIDYAERVEVLKGPARCSTESHLRAIRAGP
ncbi:Plug domain-containing protein [Luteibacter sp.]|uniref:Plug domain-containing protein n=1 Tax=Luteibacter sp. TaxID=1886636 RepID=UPI0025C57528|nr:Plug domain-containing protein [Luteibacter sp.]